MAGGLFADQHGEARGEAAARRVDLDGDHYRPARSVTFHDNLHAGQSMLRAMAKGLDGAGEDTRLLRAIRPTVHVPQKLPRSTVLNANSH